MSFKALLVAMGIGALGLVLVLSVTGASSPTDIDIAQLSTKVDIFSSTGDDAEILPANGGRAGVIDAATWSQIHTLLASGGVAPGGITPATVLTATTTVTASDLLNLPTASVELIPPPAAGRIVPVSIRATRSGGTGIDGATTQWNQSDPIGGLILTVEIAASSPDTIHFYRGFHISETSWWITDIPGGRYSWDRDSILSSDSQYWREYRSPGTFYINPGGLYLVPVGWDNFASPVEANVTTKWGTALGELGSAQVEFVVEYRLMQ